MGSVDDRTFKLNLTGNSLVKLRDSVAEKLKQFMGDYTDETLVEYVIVLLKNGRRKEEAENDLNVFLGDDSESFVSWLWDHLASNTDLHIQPVDSHMEDANKRKSTSGDETGQVKSSKLSRSRHNREWGGLARDAAEPPPFLSSEVGNVEPKTRGHSKVRRARSPEAWRKRGRSDDRQHSKIQATTVMAVINVLSKHSPDEEYISDISEPSWSENVAVMDGFLRFKASLTELESIIDERNRDRNLRNRVGAGVFPYKLLKPYSKPGVTGMGVPNSISI